MSLRLRRRKKKQERSEGSEGILNCIPLERRSPALLGNPALACEAEDGGREHSCLGNDECSVEAEGHEDVC